MYVTWRIKEPKGMCYWGRHWRTEWQCRDTCRREPKQRQIKDRGILTTTSTHYWTEVQRATVENLRRKGSQTIKTTSLESGSKTGEQWWTFTRLARTCQASNPLLLPFLNCDFLGHHLSRNQLLQENVHRATQTGQETEEFIRRPFLHPLIKPSKAFESRLEWQHTKE